MKQKMRLVYSCVMERDASQLSTRKGEQQIYQVLLRRVSNFIYLLFSDLQYRTL